MSNPPARAELARAKVNLCLHVTGQKSDGYHLLDSLVVFPVLGDLVEADPSPTLSLTLDGPYGRDLAADASNLVLRAASLMPGATAALRLQKSLPVAAGIGGGSADAAATLRLLARMSGRPLPASDAVRGLGADVPVCLLSRPARMSGIGEQISALPGLPAFWCLLVNPGAACPTPEVFRGLATKTNPPLPDLPPHFARFSDLIGYLANTRNDLTDPACAALPVIRDVLDAIGGTGPALTRMSGSGATCFGLYEDKEAALAAADRIRTAHPEWWVAAAAVSDDAGNDEIGQIDQGVPQI